MLGRGGQIGLLRIFTESWVAVLVLAWLQPAWISAADAKETAEKPQLTDLERVRQSGVLRFTTIPEQISPFVRIDVATLEKTSKRVAEGIDAELVYRLAHELGVEAKLVLPTELTIDHLFDLIESKDAEVVVGGLSILPQRQERLDFSDPYFSTNLAIIGKRGSPWKSVQDCRDLTVAMTQGASTTFHWSRLAMPDENLVKFVDFTIEGLAKVSEGEVDIAVEDEFFVRSAMKELPDLEILFTVPIEDKYGLGFGKGSELRGIFNRVLKDLKQSGELQQILDRYLAE